MRVVKNEDYEIQNTVQEHVIARMMLTIVIQWGRGKSEIVGNMNGPLRVIERRPQVSQWICLYI